jgi:alpha-ketoglutarate-dependent taurine dioxygenase
MAEASSPLETSAQVEVAPLRDGESLPLLVRSREAAVDLVGWAGEHRAELEAALLRHGGVLLRGFRVDGTGSFERAIAATSDGWAEYREAATPRTEVTRNISTSTDYPADQTIFLHNENSHCDTFPRKVYFHCVRPAARGGETPVADCRRVLAALTERLDPAALRRFREQGIQYVRNFGDVLGFPWQEVFKSGTREGVEAYCRDAGIVPEWLPGDRLRTRYVRPAVITHPLTGEETWFNHGTFFHVTSLHPEVREVMLETFAEEDLPYNTYYGDGSPIEPEVLDTLRAAYGGATVAFPWQAGDVLMLDNLLVAHGRSPFEGERRVLVGMAEPVNSSEI